MHRSFPLSRLTVPEQRLATPFPPVSSFRGLKNLSRDRLSFNVWIGACGEDSIGSLPQKTPSFKHAPEQHPTRPRSPSCNLEPTTLHRSTNVLCPLALICEPIFAKERGCCVPTGSKNHTGHFSSILHRIQAQQQTGLAHSIIILRASLTPEHLLNALNPFIQPWFDPPNTPLVTCHQHFSIGMVIQSTGEGRHWNRLSTTTIKRHLFTETKKFHPSQFGPGFIN